VHDGPFMVFDVESYGLHGEGFAVGWAVVQCRPPLRDLELLADGIAVSRAHDPLPEWVRENVLPHLPLATHATAGKMRDRFWEVWEYWREQDALLAADVPWPVEARFLAACVDDAPATRAWSGPYPLIDIASVRLAAGLDPLADEARTEFEQPAHNPLADARQSARLLMEALQR
jgi:hypothetical protein